MKSVRITLLNVIAAGLLVWLSLAVIGKGVSLSTSIWTLILIIVILIVDQFFRMALHRLSRVWLIESIFIVFCLLAIWIVRYLFKF